MLDLPSVTLLFVETRAHEIARRVIDDCRSKVTFGDTIIFTDKPGMFAGLPNATLIDCPDFPNKKLAGQFYYGQAMAAVRTDFALMLEWDAGISDVTAWRPEFFEYDYIGAPWPRNPRDRGMDVGNGGFTLMSRVLGQHIIQNFSTNPVYTDMDVCQTHRRAYEAAGFKWPSRNLAQYFSWELCDRLPSQFGYHATFTWPEVMPREEIIARAKIMMQSPYLRSKMRDLFRVAPWLGAEFTEAEMASVYPAGYYRPRTVFNRPFDTRQRAALNLMQAQRRGLISAQQQRGEKA